MSTLKWLVLPLLMISLLVAACGDDDGDTEGTATEVGATETAAATGAATEAATEAPAEAPSGSLTVYSGRSDSLIGPILEQFQAETGITVQARYGSTAEMALALLEEGSNSPADVFIAQDPGGLATVETAGLFAPLPESVLSRVDSAWRSNLDGWTGLSGRARVLVYNNELLTEDDLPTSVYDLTNEEWSGRVGWAPTNGSFQAFLTAMRAEDGEDAARQWLEDMLANGAVAYANNRAIVEAVAAGEVEVGITNHYYLHAYLAEQGEGFTARNYHFPGGDIGSMVSVAGAGVLNTSRNPDAAVLLLEYLLSDEGQQYFTDETYEYPVVAGIQPTGDLTPLDEIEAPNVDINGLSDLEGTLNLLREVGAIE